MDTRNAGNDADGSNNTLIDLETAIRSQIEKLVIKSRFHEEMSMNASTMPFRVNPRQHADVLHEKISHLRKKLRAVRRGPVIHRDIFSIDPFTK